MKIYLTPVRFAGSLLAAGILLFLAGCSSGNVNSYERAESQATPSYVADKRVINSESLAGIIRVVSINQSTVSGNLLKIQATVENLRSSTRNVGYKFEWIAQDGMAIDSPNEGWKSLTLMGRETTTISTVAVSPRAVDFKLKFRD